MVNYKQIAVFSIAVILFFSCSDEISEVPLFSIDISADSFEAAGNSKAFTLLSNMAWNASSNQDWLSVTPSSGNGEATIILTASENNSPSGRAAIVTLTPTKGYPLKINITQETSYQFSTNVSEVLLEADQQEAIIELTAKTSWSAVSSSDWLTVTPQKGSGDQVITIKTSQNESLDTRSAVIILTPGEGDPIEVTITQKGVLFSVNTSMVSFEASSKEKTIVLNSSTLWTAVSDEEWLTVTPETGEAVHEKEIRLTVQRNTAPGERKANVTLTPEKSTPIVISVSQEGADYISETVKYVSTNAIGDGSGNSKENAADFLSNSFWTKVNDKLEIESIEVIFLPGDYIRAYTSAGSLGNGLAFNRIGNEYNRLTLTGGNEVFFTVPEGYSRRNTLIHFHGSQNITLRDFNFTGDGDINYVVAIRTPAGFPPSKNISIENCTWSDMLGVVYGATGCHYEGTTEITYKDCTFKRVGLNTGSHMMYHAYGPTRINIMNCHFEDCMGEYVRFRDQTDYGVVQNSTFVRTHEYAALSFINIAVYNDVDPGNEFFGTNFSFSNNTFVNNGYDNIGAAIFFRHRGFSPPGYRYLPTREDGTKLTTGSRTERMEQFKINFGIDFDKIRVVNNSYSQRITNESTLYTYTAYGSVSLGWMGTIVLNDLLSRESAPFGWEGSW